MNKPNYGAIVFGIDDRRLGTVAGVNGCCIEILDGERRFTAKWDAVNQVNQRVELVRMAAEVGRFACGMHEAKAAV